MSKHPLLDAKMYGLNVWSLVVAIIALGVAGLLGYLQHNDATTAVKTATAGSVAVRAEHMSAHGHQIDRAYPAPNMSVPFAKVWIRGVGVSPVTDVTIDVAIRVGAVGAAPTFDDGFVTYHKGMVYPDAGWSFPQITAADNQPFIAEWVDRGGPPGKPVHPHEIAQSETDDLLSGKEILLAYVWTTYKDVFGDTHHSRSCEDLTFTNAAGEVDTEHRLTPHGSEIMSECRRYNAIDPK